ncbi:hypothetical protein AFCDBAGC_5177 [Methylobacterium cerastii]|uniref:Uncharacterized protein n=1 Tax=Methylobacterium cerastii TaxID=932741 RepID=A0ABQ4QRF1_9HYPH|nr:hypothetical protein [Methylobacterium cerastii]GJD47284.1 hypothetical protein AFCDBAGC_5177 [Methylobacterium cerastii]
MGRPALNVVTSRDPSRAALAEAIADVSAQEAGLAKVCEASDRASDLITTAFLDVETAETEIRDARATQRDEIMASVMRGDDTPGNSRLVQAEERKAEAERRLAAYRAARDDLSGALSDEEAKVAAAQVHLRECRTAVLWEALPALVAASMPLRQELAEYAQAIDLITERSPGFMSADDPRRKLLDAANRIRQPILSLGSGVTFPTPAYAEWKAAIHSLGFDPDAPLPNAA